MATKTIEEIRADIIEYVKVQLGPIYEDTEANRTVISNLELEIENEAFSVGNRLSVTSATLIDMFSIIVQCTVIAYQNRGVEGQTRQDELGQQNYLVNWHQYLQEEVVRHGKRFVI